MSKLQMAPTKSNLLLLKRQLAFAEEGYDLLEQKRQILIFELMSRLNRAEKAEKDIRDALQKAFAALQSAELDSGSEALDQAALAARMEHHITVANQHLMGMKIPVVSTSIEPPEAPFGIGGTTSNTDLAMLRFAALLPLIAALAELENTVMRLAGELRKTQRRCNALSKIFIPDYRETISYILGSLEERERESFVILKMIRERMGAQS
ncbi:MAG TPA: V-type ATP synthase subunit D [Syntrophorhabdaceae bacterium]|nr:V-type ATP synthase subunit D [Syntrophorhabdaceae bacterium]